MPTRNQTASPRPPRLSVLDEEGLSNTIRNPHSTFRRRRLTISGNSLILNLPRRPSSVDDSSQDEYEESESESDRVMTSSSEDIYHSTLASQLRRGSIAVSEEEEEDNGQEAEEAAEEDSSTHMHDNAASTQCFTPQPNAFSHPRPSLSRHSESIPGSYFPASNQTNHASTARHSYPTDTRRQTHTPFNAVAPNSTLDHDALLRDSLSTLLSCAAAARGIPKSQHTHTQPKGSDAIEPGTLRIVSEQALSSRQGATQRLAGPAISSRSSSKGKGKRKTGSRSRSTSKDRQEQALKRQKNSSTTDAAVAPTLLTWCVAGGVVVLVSALSFSAGYAVGKEIGRLETTTGLGQVGAGECGKEALKGGLGLRRWSSEGVAAVAAVGG